MNRKTRRAKISAFRKELATANFDNFINITSPEALERFCKIKIGEFESFWRNSIYSVQVYRRFSCKILGIRRHDQQKSCPWKHRQIIKNEIIGKEHVGVEFMPPEEEVVDQANMYWILTGPPVDLLYESYGGLKWKK